MKRFVNSPQRFCFISNSNHNYLVEYITLSHNDSRIDFSIKNINLTQLKNYSPSVIIIDQYFNDSDYNSIINSIKMNFKNAKIYFLSPEYANYNRVIQSINNKNHFYSNFSVVILNHINSYAENNNSENDYLEAG